MSACSATMKLAVARQGAEGGQLLMLLLGGERLVPHGLAEDPGCCGGNSVWFQAVSPDSS